MFNLENAIQGWLRKFRKYQGFHQGSVQEMELHLRDHIDDLIGEGWSEQEAFEKAVKEFGEVPKVASEEYQNLRTKRTMMSAIRITLLKNYFKTSTRTLLKNPLTSIINIFGLAMAIGICLVVYSFISWNLSIDRHHENKDEVYLVTYFVDRDGEEEQYGSTPTALGALLRQDLSQIEKVCRVEDRSVVIKHGDKVFFESVRYADAEFLEMLTFPLKWGFSGSLADMNSIILSEKMATKYFGDENPIGQDVLVKFDSQNGKTFKVSGVAASFPKAHVIEFDFLINFENLQVSDPNYDMSNWKEFVDATLIQVNDPLDVSLIEEKMGKYVALHNEVDNNWAIAEFGFEQLATLHQRTGEIRGDIGGASFIEGIIVLPIIGLFMIALACFNYINIAIVSAAKRLKEIGLRKVIGANRKLIIIQFLTENIFVTFFALVLGLILAITLFQPWFANLAGFPLELSLLDINLWFFLLGILLFTGIISGVYPAFYIAKFEVVKIFKGKVAFGKKNPLTKLFLAFQLILACITITGGVVFAQNSTYQKKRSWGYNQKETLYTQLLDEGAFRKLERRLAQNPAITSIAGSAHHLGKSSTTTVIQFPDRKYEVNELSVSANYFETMGLKLKEGRSFMENYKSENRSVVINETMAIKMGLNEPLSTQFKIDSISYTVLGVVDDFHTNNFYYEVTPTIFTFAAPASYKYLSVRTKDGKTKEVCDTMQKEWAQLFPEVPFQGGYQEDVWSSFFEDLDVQQRFMRAVATIAILLAGLGLYGLVRLNISGRYREFSIRRTLGAEVKDIAKNMVKQYYLLTIIALILGAPVSYILIKANLSMLFPEPMPIGITGLVFPLIILISVLLLVFLSQVRKVAKSNPVDGLKAE